ncbi:14898_t:CDS:2 [Rhizophagus irregularis]|nr:14898_t:CDS:2 [Rhizophagus irregularis]
MATKLPDELILPLISYLDKEIRNSLKIEENNKTKTNNIQEKPTFNYVSFIKELDYTNMCYQAITCLKKLRNNPKDYSIMNDNYLYYGMMQIFEQNSYHVIKHEIENILNVKSTIKQEDSNKFIESILLIILNNSRIETLILDIFYWRSKDIFNILLKIPEQIGNNGFTGFFLKKFHCKLLVKDIDILYNILKLSNNQIRDLSLNLINLIKSQYYLEKLHINYNSLFIKLILLELQNNFYSIMKLNLISHNNVEDSGFYFLDDEWSNSLELTFNDLNFVDNLKDFPLLNLKFLKLDWDTLNFNHLQSQENELHQSIINLIQYHNIDLKHINLNPLLKFHFRNIFKII